MDVAEPYAPLHRNGHDVQYDERNSDSEPDAPGELRSIGGVATDAGVDEARRRAERLVVSADGLSRALASAESERSALHDERDQLRRQVEELENAVARNEEFRTMFLLGTGAAVSAEDLQSLQSVTATLAADPDRLTALFAVVQQAKALDHVVRVYSELREMAGAG